MGELVKGMTEWIREAERETKPPKKRKRSGLLSKLRTKKSDLGKQIYRAEYEKARMSALRVKAKQDAKRDVFAGKTGIKGSFLKDVASGFGKVSGQIYENMEANKRAGFDPFGSGPSRSRKKGR